MQGKNDAIRLDGYQSINQSIFIRLGINSTQFNNNFTKRPAITILGH